MNRSSTTRPALGVLFLGVALVLLTSACGKKASSGAASVQSGDLLALGQRTKSSGCTVNGALPDSDCTPGAIFSDATTAQICKAGYATSVRDVPVAEKDQVYAEYGIASHRAGQYEVDHLVSLEIGGSNDIANLWPEAASPQPGYHQKDRFENYLHDQVCGGKLTLQQAQGEIAHDWLKYWTAAGMP